VVQQSHIGLKIHYTSISMANSSAFKRCTSYATKGSMARWAGATKTHLIDSSLDVYDVKQNLALNNFISMIVVVMLR